MAMGTWSCRQIRAAPSSVRSRRQISFSIPVVYDRFAQRFIVIALERVNPPSTTVSRILIAASPVATSPGFAPSTAVWNYRAVDAKETIAATGIEYWADFPTAAVDGEALYITVNMFPFTGGNFLSSRVWIVTKSQLYNSATAGTAAAVRHDPFTLAGVSTEGAYGSAPAHVFGANGVLDGKGTYLAGWATPDADGQNRLSVIRIANPIPNPLANPPTVTAFTHRYVNVGNIHDRAFTSSTNYPDAPQMGDAIASPRIDTGDMRVQNLVARFYANSTSTTADDHWSLYLANTIVPRAAAVGQPANPDQGEATVHW